MTPAEAQRAPVRLLLSGPAGGVTASRQLAERQGQRNVITFDMGGTSTDVGLIVGGEPVVRRETVVGKYHLLLPMVDVKAIGAGGGSLARVEDGGYLRVGPESAGADPGPACYGRGGEQPTVTDADVVLGIIDPARFLGGRLALDASRALAAIDLHVARPLRLEPEAAAIGIKRIVDARMADLLRTVTIQQGHDPRGFVLHAYGGAGPTHAPAFALALVDEILVPATQTVHSAVGAACSELGVTVERAVPMRAAREGGGSDVDPEAVELVLAELATAAREALARQGAPPGAIVLRRLVEVRFSRQTKALAVPYPGSVAALLVAFLAAYARRYGAESVPEAAGFELVTFVVEASAPSPAGPRPHAVGRARGRGLAAIGERAVFDPGSGSFAPTPIVDGELLGPGDRFTGPVVIEYAGTTVAVPSGQVADVDEQLGIRIVREA